MDFHRIGAYCSGERRLPIRRRQRRDGLVESEWNFATDIGTVINNAVNNGVGTAWATSTVNVNNGGDKTGCYCPTGSPGNWTWGTAVTCGSTCTGGSVAGQFVTITASPSASVPALFPAFGLTYSGTISRGALVRLE